MASVIREIEESEKKRREYLEKIAESQKKRLGFELTPEYFEKALDRTISEWIATLGVSISLKCQSDTIETLEKGRLGTLYRMIKALDNKVCEMEETIIGLEAENKQLKSEIEELKTKRRKANDFKEG